MVLQLNVDLSCSYIRYSFIRGAQRLSCLDVRNAFNSVHRSKLLEEVNSSFPDIFAHVKSMYESINPHIYMREGKPFVLSSKEGVHHGDTLGPVLFATCINPTQNKNLEV